MALTKRVSPVGNSAGVTFDKPILKQLGWQIGTHVDFKVSGRKLILSPREATDEEAQAAGSQIAQTRRKLIERLAKR